MNNELFEKLRVEITQEIADIVGDCDEEVRSVVLQIVVYSCFGLLLSRGDTECLLEIKEILENEILSKH